MSKVNQTIWKWSLHTYANSVPAPDGAVLTSAAWQGDSMVVWGVVDRDSQRKRHRLVMVVNTGHDVRAYPAPDLKRSRFLGTVTHDGQVYHVFDCGLDIQHESNRDIFERLLAEAKRTTPCVPGNP